MAEGLKGDAQSFFQSTNWMGFCYGGRAQPFGLTVPPMGCFPLRAGRAGDSAGYARFFLLNTSRPVR